jgi:hypothetical protein
MVTRVVIVVCVAVILGGVAWRLLGQRVPAPSGAGANVKDSSATENDGKHRRRRDVTELALPKMAGQKGKGEHAALHRRMVDARERRRKRIEAYIKDGGVAGLLPEIHHAGRLPEDYVFQAGESLKPQVKACFDQALAKQPNMQRKVVVYYDILAEPEVGGMLNWAELVGDMGNWEPGFAGCVKGLMQGARFPPPKWGGHTRHGHTYHFPKDEDGAKAGGGEAPAE